MIHVTAATARAQHLAYLPRVTLSAIVILSALLTGPLFAVSGGIVNQTGGYSYFPNPRLRPDESRPSTGVISTTAPAQLRPVVYLPMVVMAGSLPDAFEPDDSCAAASAIAPGDVQSRTFVSLIPPATVADVDYIRVQFAQAGSYDAHVSATDSQLAPRVELSVVCPGAVLDAFTPDSPVRLIVPSDNYSLVLKAFSQNPSVLHMQNTGYRLSLSNRISLDMHTHDAGTLRVVKLPPADTHP